MTSPVRPWVSPPTCPLRPVIWQLSLTTKKGGIYFDPFPVWVNHFFKGEIERQAPRGRRKAWPEWDFPRSNPSPTKKPVISSSTGSFTIPVFKTMHPTHPSSSPDFVQLQSELIHLLSISCSSRQSWRWGSTIMPKLHRLNLSPTHTIAALNGLYIYCKMTFVLGFWRISGWRDSWVSMAVGWGWVYVLMVADWGWWIGG